MSRYHVPQEEQRFPVVARCEGCGHRDGNFCRVYRVPETKWTRQPCPMATFMKKAIESTEKYIDPIKASKRSVRGRGR